MCVYIKGMLFKIMSILGDQSQNVRKFCELIRKDCHLEQSISSLRWLESVMASVLSAGWNQLWHQISQMAGISYDVCQEILK